METFLETYHPLDRIYVINQTPVCERICHACETLEDIQIYKNVNYI